MINPGTLKHRIHFYSNVTSVDSQGFKVTTASKILSTKCSIKKSYFQESNRSTSKNLDTHNDYVICTIRYNKLINDSCTVELKGVKYRIKSLNNVNGLDKILEITLQNG